MSGVLLVFYWCLCVLAVYRVAHLTTMEDGPARIFTHIREAVFKKWGWDSWQAEGARCVLCQSVWYAFAAAWMLQPENIFQLGLYWLSIAAGVLVLHRFTYKGIQNDK